jgi:hypothetical protein
MARGQRPITKQGATQPKAGSTFPFFFVARPAEIADREPPISGTEGGEFTDKLVAHVEIIVATHGQIDSLSF